MTSQRVEEIGIGMNDERFQKNQNVGLVVNGFSVGKCQKIL